MVAYKWRQDAELGSESPSGGNCDVSPRDCGTVGVLAQDASRETPQDASGGRWSPDHRCAEDVVPLPVDAVLHGLLEACGRGVAS